jgi:hypothetical protein
LRSDTRPSSYTSPSLFQLAQCASRLPAAQRVNQLLLGPAASPASQAATWAWAGNLLPRLGQNWSAKSAPFDLIRRSRGDLGRSKSPAVDRFPNPRIILFSFPSAFHSTAAARGRCPRRPPPEMAEVASLAFLFPFPSSFCFLRRTEDDGVEAAAVHGGSEEEVAAPPRGPSPVRALARG